MFKKDLSINLQFLVDFEKKKGGLEKEPIA